MTFDDEESRAKAAKDAIGKCGEEFKKAEAAAAKAGEPAKEMPRTLQGEGTEFVASGVEAFSFTEFEVEQKTSTLDLMTFMKKHQGEVAKMGTESK